MSKEKIDSLYFREGYVKLSEDTMVILTKLVNSKDINGVLATVEDLLNGDYPKLITKVINSTRLGEGRIYANDIDELLRKVK